MVPQWNIRVVCGKRNLIPTHFQVYISSIQNTYLHFLVTFLESQLPLSQIHQLWWHIKPLSPMFKAICNATTDEAAKDLSPLPQRVDDLVLITSLFAL